MIVKRMPLGVYQANCYILIDSETHETIVIDPAGEFEVLKRYLEQEKCNVRYIILTHSHADHIGALNELKSFTNAPICVHEDDVSALNDATLNLTSIMGKTKVEVLPDKIVRDGETFNIGKFELKILHTPGHTPGCICVYGSGKLFSGDTLFASSIGRTDLVGGSYTDIMQSLKRLAGLPGDTQVFPGHGPSTSIDKERTYNPFLQECL